jgi:site-specific DNA recombinase
MKTQTQKVGLFGKKLKVEDYEYALSYCRVSSKKQEIEGTGLDSQATRNETLARTHNLKIEATFPDIGSSKGQYFCTQ